ncbi:MAG TPA: DUF427 domain-containing protein [Cyclobacteriaceae bacterium]
MKAIWNGEILAESENVVKVEGNHYFPFESLRKEYFIDSDTKTICPWKGAATYFNIKIGENIIKDGAWTYKTPGELAQNIKGHVAFDGRIEIK